MSAILSARPVAFAGLLLGSLLGSATAQEAVTLAEKFPVDHLSKVDVAVKLTGRLSLPAAGKDKQPEVVMLAGTSRLTYDERTSHSKGKACGQTASLNSQHTGGMTHRTGSVTEPEDAEQVCCLRAGWHGPGQELDAGISRFAGWWSSSLKWCAVMKLNISGGKPWVGRETSFLDDCGVGCVGSEGNSSNWVAVVTAISRISHAGHTAPL